MDCNSHQFQLATGEYQILKTVLVCFCRIIKAHVDYIQLAHLVLSFVWFCLFYPPFICYPQFNLIYCTIKYHILTFAVHKTGASSPSPLLLILETYYVCHCKNSQTFRSIFLRLVREIKEWIVLWIPLHALLYPNQGITIGRNTLAT